MSTAKIDAFSLADRPGQLVQRHLQTMPETDRLPFLAYMLEAAACANDTEILEAVRGYRLMVEGKPYLRIVPRSE
jgi:hypothetical protein